ncbi:MAG: 50S ribosomal protein L30 [Actinomycetota bacterium]|nr:50S ribosomal protein L30 [Actinomycetota bacterium]
MAASVRIVQRRSASGTSPRQREALRTLGLGRIGAATERPDHPTVQGALRVVSHLVEVER